MSTTTTTSEKTEIYSPTARGLHWLTVALVALQVPIGLIMVYRGSTLDIWDTLTNTLYSSHKLIGLVILTVVLVRLVYRVTQGAPQHEPTLTTWQIQISLLNHTWMYLLLIVTPLLGWLGVSLFPALDIFGLFQLPALAAPDQQAAGYVFAFHIAAASLLVAMIVLHVAAALYHRFVRRDAVLSRMLPQLGRVDDRG